MSTNKEHTSLVNLIPNRLGSRSQLRDGQARLDHDSYNPLLCREIERGQGVWYDGLVLGERTGSMCGNELGMSPCRSDGVYGPNSLAQEGSPLAIHSWTRDLQTSSLTQQGDQIWPVAMRSDSRYRD